MSFKKLLSALVISLSSVGLLFFYYQLLIDAMNLWNESNWGKIIALACFVPQVGSVFLATIRHKIKLPTGIATGLVVALGE